MSDDGFRHPSDRPKKRRSRSSEIMNRGLVPALTGIEQEDIPGLVPAGRAVKNVFESAIKAVSGSKPKKPKKRR